MKELRHIIALGICGLWGSLAIVSCTDGNDWETDSSYERLFSTLESSFSITPADKAAQAEASWKATPNTTYYVIEVSTNPLSDQVAMGAEGNIVFGNGIEKITDTEYLMEDLEPETTYYARIKSVNKNGLESQWIYYDEGGTFQTKKEEVLGAASEITSSTIRITWEENCTVTSLRIYNEAKGYDQTILLESTDLEACAVTVSGLSPMTTYTFEIYNGTKLRGTTTVTTAAGEMAEVEVSGIGKTEATLTWDIEGADGYALVSDGTIPTAATSTLSEVQTCTVSGLTAYTSYTFYLFSEGNIVGTATFTTLRDYPSGYEQVSITSVAEWDAALGNTYSTSDVVFIISADLDLSASSAELTSDKGLKNVIFWGEGTSKPKLNMTLDMEGDLGTVEFYHLEMSSTQGNSWSRTYLINYQDNASISEIKVEDCEITETGVAIRGKMSSGTFGNITVNNTLFNNCHEMVIGIHEIDTNATANGTISITNSTIMNPENYVVRTRYHQYTFAVDGFTFYGTISRTIFDDSGMSSTISISNSLFGGVNSSIRLYADNMTATTADNLFCATDFRWRNSSYNVTDTDLTTDELFPNAASGDLTVGSETYKSYGDPRWR